MFSITITKQHIQMLLALTFIFSILGLYVYANGGVRMRFRSPLLEGIDTSGNGTDPESQFIKQETNYWTNRKYPSGGASSDLDKFWKFTGRDTSTSDKPMLVMASPEGGATDTSIAQKVAQCKAITNLGSSAAACSQLGTDCGWCTATNTGMYGTADGPAVDVCNGTWVFGSDACTKTFNKQQCASIGSCRGIAGTNCGWCASSNKAMAGTASGPMYSDDTCDSSSWIYGDSTQCDNYYNDHPCVGPNSSTGPQSAQCVAQLWQDVGCTTSGDVLNNLITQQGWTSAGKSVSDVTNDMQTNWVNQITNTSADYDTRNTASQQCKGTTLNPCDPAFNGNLPLACLEQTWQSVGCTPQGTASPDTNASWRAQWSAMTVDQLQTSMQQWQTNRNSSDYDTANATTQQCLGTSLPPPPPTPPPPQYSVSLTSLDPGVQFYLWDILGAAVYNNQQDITQLQQYIPLANYGVDAVNAAINSIVANIKTLLSTSQGANADPLDVTGTQLQSAIIAMWMQLAAQESCSATQARAVGTGTFGGLTLNQYRNVVYVINSILSSKAVAFPAGTYGSQTYYPCGIP